MNPNVAVAATKFDSAALRHMRRAIETEMLAAVARGEGMTQAHVGQIEMLTAIGAELLRRNELSEPTPFVDTCIEHGPGGALRLPFQVRVF